MNIDENDEHPSIALPLFPGLSLNHNQLFFLSFSQVWCSKSTPQSLKLQVKNCHLLESCVKFTFLCDSRNLSSKLWNRNTNKTTVSTFDFSQGPERPAQPRALPRDRRPLQLEGVRRGLPLRRGIQDEPGAQVRGLVATTPPSSSP